MHRHISACTAVDMVVCVTACVNRMCWIERLNDVSPIEYNRRDVLFEAGVLKL